MADFEKMFLENRDFIFRYLMKKARDRSLAEELTQETFFRAYMNYASLRDKEKAPAWLCRIAENTYYAWYNEQKKKVSLESLDEQSDGENIEDAFVRKELSDSAVRCLNGLDEPYREVFKLSVFGGLSLREISAVFGKSESWARVTFYRARQKIIEKMKKE